LPDQKYLTTEILLPLKPPSVSSIAGKSLKQPELLLLLSTASTSRPAEAAASQSGGTALKQREKSDLGDAFHVERIDEVNMPTFSSVVRQSALPDT
jgi:hypothetical protein